MNSYEIDKILMKSNVNKEQLIEVMYNALSIMQRCNGNTVDCCVEEAMKDNNLIRLPAKEKDEIKFGIGTITPANVTLYVDYKGIHKEFSVGSDSWKTASFVYDAYNCYGYNNSDDYFIIDQKHNAYPILKRLIDSNTDDDEINGEAN